MSLNKPAAARQVTSRGVPAVFRRSPIAAFITGISLLAMSPLHAQTVEELQAEITRLKAALEKSQSELAKRGVVQAETPTTTAVSGADTVPAVQAGNSGDATTLDTVVVRAKPKLEKLQDAPVSASVISGADLERLGATDISAVLKRGGNVTWNQGNQRTSSLSIRGIGKVGQLEAMDPSVGVTIDGVPLAFNPLTSSYAFFDLDTVDVLRGPQGTAGGKNTGLGVINVNTRRPTFTPSTEWGLTIGQYDRLESWAAIGGPVIDDLLAYRASFSVQRGNGWLNNNYVQREDRGYNNEDRVTGRIQFLLTPSPDFSARLILEKSPNAGEYTNTTGYQVPVTALPGQKAPSNIANAAKVARDYFSPNAAKVAQNLASYWTQGDLTINSGYPLLTGSNGVTAELNWSLPSGHTLTSITGYRDYHFNAQNDDGTNGPFSISDTGGVYDNYQQISQELRLASAPGGFVDYTTGIYLLKTNVHYTSFSNGLSDSGAWSASNDQYNLLYHGVWTKTSTASPTSAIYGGAIDGAGTALMRDATNGILVRTVNQIQNDSQALYANANWHLKDDLTLTTGARFTFEHRTNPSWVELADQGVGSLLNPIKTSNGQVNLGGFKLTATSVDAKGVANIGSDYTVSGNTANADLVAQKYFGAANFAALTPTQKAQIAAAQALRSSQIGALYSQYTPSAFDKVQPNFVVSPSWKINDQVSTYVSWQYGEKAGVAQVISGANGPINGTTKPEQSNAYEWGVKSSLFNDTLVLNADIFLTNIKNYLQALSVPDPTQTNFSSGVSYISWVGNVPKVQAKGVEWDGVFRGIENLELTFSGAYNDARYKSFKFAAQPVESSATGPNDLSGKTLTGASKWTWNLGGSYRHPIGDGKVFHFDWNTTYASKFNADLNLSSYAWIPGHYTTDLAVGVGTLNKAFDVSLLVKNAFNDNTPTTAGYGTITLPWPRWVGLQFTGKL